MDNPPDEIRPGLSCTAQGHHGHPADAVTVPLQALTVRQKGDLEAEAGRRRHRAGSRDSGPGERKEKKEELQGVFVVKAGKARLPEGDTGITGATDIEVLNGLRGRGDCHRQLQDHPHAFATTRR